LPEAGKLGPSGLKQRRLLWAHHEPTSGKAVVYFPLFFLRRGGYDSLK